MRAAANHTKSLKGRVLNRCLPQSFAQLPLDARFEQSERHVEHYGFGRAPRAARQALRELDDARAGSARRTAGYDGCAEQESVPCRHPEAALHSRQRCPKTTAAMSRSAQRCTELTESARNARMQLYADGALQA